MALEVMAKKIISRRIPPPPPPPPHFLTARTISSDVVCLPSPPPDQSPDSSSIDSVICRMMSKRKWTTRLQNSIRSVALPEFTTQLVLSVLHRWSSTMSDYDQALRFFRWVEKTGFNHDHSTYLKMIQILTSHRKNNHPRCILLDDMIAKGIQPDETFFMELIRAYSRNGIVQECVKMFQKMNELGVKRTVLSYNSFFSAILKHGRVQMAKRYFNKMVGEDGVAPNLHTYSKLIWGFCLSSKMVTARRFFDDMKEKGLNPDVVCYNTMIDGYCRAKNMEEAERMLEDMKSQQVNPDVITYTSLIKGYVNSGRVEQGFELFNEMSSHSGIRPNWRTYSTLLCGLVEKKETMISAARNLLNDMVLKNYVPRDQSVFIDMMKTDCKLGNLDKALWVLRVMEKFKVRADCRHYGLLIENFCDKGIHETAVKLLDEVMEKGVLLSTPESSETPAMEPAAYNPLIQYLCRNRQTAKAEVFFRQLMKKGVDDSIAFNNLIAGHAKDGVPESGVNLLTIMRRRGVPTDPIAHCSIVESFLEKGDPAETKNALDCMIESGHLPSGELFRKVMLGLFDDGRVQTASRVMKSMLEKEVVENSDVMAKILETLLMRGHVEEALGRIELMSKKGCSVDFDGLLRVLCEKKKESAALKLLDFGLQRDYGTVDFSSYDVVLDALLAAGRTLNAYALLCKISETGGVVKQSSCKDLIQKLIAQGNTKQADILSRMVLGKQSASKKALKSS